jgi:hypothetical protein
MVMTPDTAMMSPSSTISSLTQSTRGDTNRAIRDVLYGVTESSIEVPSTPSFSTGNLGLRHLLIHDVLQLQEEVSPKLVIFFHSTRGSSSKIFARIIPLYLAHYCYNWPTQLCSTLQQQHEFKRLGQSHFEFQAVVMLSPK